MKRLKLVHAVEQFAHYSDVELDLRLRGIGGQIAGQPCSRWRYLCPEIEWPLTTGCLGDYDIEGTRIDDREGLLAKGHDIDALRDRGQIIFFQVFRDGFSR